ncbi:MAG TPA: hypothetical protein VLU41_01220 [Ideonella sp.]|nr:hypothetical protein [Ideonella sp.]
MAALRAVLRWLFTWAVALVVLFEEWGWEPLARLAARLAQLPGLRWFERRIARLSPYAALAALGVPALALVPVKLAALAAIAAGQPLLGVSVVVLAKVLGTAVVARLFQLTRPALLRLPWFAQTYARWLAWKQAVLADVRASQAWRMARRARLRASRVLRGWAGR